MNDRQRQTEFLRQCLLYDQSKERHELAERLRHVQRNERCVRRAVWFMVLLATLSLAGLAYLTVFLLPDFPYNLPRFLTQFMTKLFCALALGSLICIPAFVGLEVVYRKELNARREECRRLATSLLEARLGKPGALNATTPETSDQNDNGGNRTDDNIRPKQASETKPKE